MFGGIVAVPFDAIISVFKGKRLAEKTRSSIAILHA